MQSTKESRRPLQWSTMEHIHDILHSTALPAHQQLRTKYRKNTNGKRLHFHFLNYKGYLMVSDKLNHYLPGKRYYFACSHSSWWSCEVSLCLLHCVLILDKDKDTMSEISVSRDIWKQKCLQVFHIFPILL